MLDLVGDGPSFSNKSTVQMVPETRQTGPSTRKSQRGFVITETVRVLVGVGVGGGGRQCRTVSTETR